MPDTQVNMINETIGDIDHCVLTDLIQFLL